jgi:hypothetical protein
MILHNVSAKVRFISGALAATAMWTLVSAGLSAQTSAAGPDLNQAIAQLKGDQWAKRSEAFYRLVALGAAAGQGRGVKPALSGLIGKNPQKADELKAALAATLGLENQVARKGGSLPGDFTDYYGDLIMAVSSINDPRSVNALAGALGTGNMVISALVAFGDASVDAVIRQIDQNTDRTVRLSGCSVLQKMADPATQPPIKDAVLKQKIQQTLAGPACVKKG